jgi:phosphopantetheine adenylyltransferase
MASEALLLLPSPPTSLDTKSISNTYRLPITETVNALKDESTSTELMIAIIAPDLENQLTLPRAAIYKSTQHLLALVYSLFCAVCARSRVEVESGLSGSLDVRIVLLTPSASKQQFSGGPIVDVDTFTTSSSYKKIFSPDDEHTRSILAKLQQLSLRNGFASIDVHRIASESSSRYAVSQTSQDHLRDAIPHYVVAVGGTFDHVHAGHKLLLTATALLLQPSSKPRRLIVGITGDELLKNKKYAQYLGSWKQRQDEVVQFLLSILLFRYPSTKQDLEVSTPSEPVPNGTATHTRLVPYNLTIECVQIQDPFGPTITDESVTALVVSGETRSGGQAVNDERTKKGWAPLEVFEIDVLDSGESEDSSKTENFASKISSTAIRKRIAESGGKPSL